MEEGSQKSKRLSHMAKFKHKFVCFAEEKGKLKVTTIFRVEESNILLWWKHRSATIEFEATQNKFTGPKKG
jgi:hypothetical protein